MATHFFTRRLRRRDKRGAPMPAVGLHHPLAAALGRRGQSEWALALEWLAQRPARALLLADRLHGGAAFVAVAQAACEKVGSHFLIRARSNLRVQTVKRFKDGSRLVRVPVRAKGEHQIGRAHV